MDTVPPRLSVALAPCLSVPAPERLVATVRVVSFSTDPVTAILGIEKELPLIVFELPAKVMPPLVTVMLPLLTILPLTDHWVTSVNFHCPPEFTVTSPRTSVRPGPPQRSTSVPLTLVRPPTDIGLHDGSNCVPLAMLRLPVILIAAPS